MVYTTNIPQPADLISNSQAQILANFQFLGSTLGNLANGWYDLPNGTTLQWGESPNTINAGLSAELPFPKAYSGPGYIVVFTEIKNSSSSTNKLSLSSQSDITATGFKVQLVSGSNVNIPTRVSFFSIGPT